MHLSPGTQLDGYEILGLLGAGGMGEVYRARDPILKREVAIKVLPAFVSQEPDRLRRFEQEAQAAAALNHPNILAIHRFGVFEGSPYLVSELLEGTTLRQLLERGPLPVRKAIDYGVQIAHGVAAAHEKGIVHRDLKPENLFVTKDGRIKILDFGVAKLTQPQRPQSGAQPGSDAPTATHHATEPGLVMGTIGYMAPEQVRGQTVDHRTDIFALGAVLYEMLAGKRAFQRSTSADTMAAILNEDPPGISQIVQTTPLGLQRVVHRCLEKNPEQRFQSASDLAFALEALSESGISSGGAVVAASMPRRSPLLLWLGGLSAVLVVGAAGYYFHHSARAKGSSLPLSHQQITFLGKAHMPAISPDGRSVAYVVSEPGSGQKLMVQDLSGGPSLELLHSEDVMNPDWSPDGSELLVAFADLRQGLSISAVSRLGGVPRRIGWGAYTCWLHKGTEIARVMQNPEGGIAFVNQVSGKERVVPIPHYDWLMGMDCSVKSDKLLLLTVTDGKSQIWAMTAEGKEQRKLIEGEKGVTFLSPRWSAANDTIYFFRQKDSTMELMKLPLSGSTTEPSVLVGGLETGDYLTLSADGSQLAYTREQHSMNLWSIVLPSAGAAITSQKPLTSGTLWYRYPTISPDGRWVAFTMGTGTRGDVYKMSLDGGKPIQLTSVGDALTCSPAWSPDGKRIAFISDQGGTAKVWIVNALGGAARVLDKTDASDTNQDLAWYPSPEIIYSSKGLHNLRRLDPETQHEEPILPKDSDGWLLGKAEFSPDGKQIAICWNRDPAAGTWLISLKDLSESQLSPDQRPLGWSPDGKSVYAFSSGEGVEILQVKVGDSKKPRAVATLPGIIRSGTVSPDGKRIIVSVAEDKSDVWLLKNFDPEATPVQ